MGFREDFLNFKGTREERENFIFNAVTTKLTRDQIINSMTEVKVPGPNNTEIVYKIMPQFVSIDGMTVPMSASTAQRAAQHFGLKLPPAQVSRSIYLSNDPKVKRISAKPFSGSGALLTKEHGEKKDTYYSPSAVVQDVSRPGLAAAYDDWYKKQLDQAGVKPGEVVIGTHKENNAPIKGEEGSHHMSGMWIGDKEIQRGSRSAHSTEELQSEYALASRFMLGEAKVVDKETGKVLETKKLEELYPTMSEYKVKTPKVKSEKPKSEPKPQSKSDSSEQENIFGDSKPSPAVSTPSTPTSPVKPSAQTAPSVQPAVKPTTSVPTGSESQPSMTPEQAQQLQERIQGIDSFLDKLGQVTENRRHNIIKRAVKLWKIKTLFYK